MKMKKIIAAMAASAVSLTAMAGLSLSASAAETTISYAQSAGSLNTDNDGNSLRRNIINEWQNNTQDVSKNTTVNDHVTINFTVSGIGNTSALDDGSQYYAWIAGTIGGNAAVWSLAEAGDNAVAINGDGDYSVTWPLAEGSDTIEIFILQTNINIWQFGEGLDATTANLTINSITTDDGVAAATDAPTEAPTNAPAETTAAPAADGTTTAAPAADGKTTTTAAATTAAGAATTTAAEKAAATGDAGVGVAAAAIAVAGAAAFAARKKD